MNYVMFISLMMFSQSNVDVASACKAYNNWREGVFLKHQEIMRDEIPYLSWNAFVVQKKGEELARIPTPCGMYNFYKLYEDKP